MPESSEWGLTIDGIAPCGLVVGVRLLKSHLKRARVTRATG